MQGQLGRARKAAADQRINICLSLCCPLPKIADDKLVTQRRQRLDFSGKKDYLSQGAGLESLGVVIGKCAGRCDYYIVMKIIVIL